MSRLLVSLSCLVATANVAEGSFVGSLIPCHLRHDKNRPAHGCGTVTIPAGLCPSCGLTREFSAVDGSFDHCRYTTGLQDRAGIPNHACANKLSEYVADNPCDSTRADDLDWFNGSDARLKKKGRARLDFFLYALCHQGCDCIPAYGVDPAVKETDIFRANCQAHAFYDICTVLPNIKLVRGEGTEDTDDSTLPNVCPLLSNWFDLHGADFYENPTTPVNSDVSYFLERTIEATELFGTNTFWGQCIEVELLQKRISTTFPPASTSSPSDKPSILPSVSPSVGATSGPSSVPSGQPTDIGTVVTTTIPSVAGSLGPSADPSFSSSQVVHSFEPSVLFSETPTTLLSGAPSLPDTSLHTHGDTQIPSFLPSDASSKPTSSITSSTLPTVIPSPGVSDLSTPSPIAKSSVSPTVSWSTQPSEEASLLPTIELELSSNGPSLMQTARSAVPSHEPSLVLTSTVPSDESSLAPTSARSDAPSNEPSLIPTAAQSSAPTVSSETPSGSQSLSLTSVGSEAPSTEPSVTPTVPITQSSDEPSLTPTLASAVPSDEPSVVPTSTVPSMTPSATGSEDSTDQPSLIPTGADTSDTPSLTPTNTRSAAPSDEPSVSPTTARTGAPSDESSMVPPTTQISAAPSSEPPLLAGPVPVTTSGAPSEDLSTTPTIQTRGAPSVEPTLAPSSSESVAPSEEPSVTPMSEAPSLESSLTPSTTASVVESDHWSLNPTTSVSEAPRGHSSPTPTSSLNVSPSFLPSVQPSQTPSTLFSSEQPSTDDAPTESSDVPTSFPSDIPTTLMIMSSYPTVEVTISPSNPEFSSESPSTTPSIVASLGPTREAGGVPSQQPSSVPRSQETNSPSKKPVGGPTGSKVQCHVFGNRNRPARSCEKITIPDGLCHTCGINPNLYYDGSYHSCKYLTGLQGVEGGTLNQACVDKLDEFVLANTCDTERAKHLSWLKGTDARLFRRGRNRLDFFLYSLCHQPCDCIPARELDPNHKETDIFRPHCQARVHYDVCLLFPNVKLIRGEGSLDNDVTAMPAICPLVSNWVDSFDGNIFLDPTTTVDNHVGYFLARFLDGSEVQEGNSLWQQCVNIELLQGRVHTIAPHASPSLLPSWSPSLSQSSSSSGIPSANPSSSPGLFTSEPGGTPSLSQNPTSSDFQSDSPSVDPSASHVPSEYPNFSSELPSEIPSFFLPSSSPSDVPSVAPSDSPSEFPSDVPSEVPSDYPSHLASAEPSSVPSSAPSVSMGPSTSPSHQPSELPTTVPSLEPSHLPSLQPSMSHEPTFMPTQASDDILINCGVLYYNYTATNGETWISDRLYNDGTLELHTTQFIRRTVEDPLYKSWREGPFINYSIPLTPGEYVISVHFSENQFQLAGARLFDVIIEGKVARHALDVFQVTGNKLDRRAYEFPTVTDVVDGSLDLQFVGLQGNNAMIMAIEIRRNGPHLAHAVPGGPYSVVDVDGNGFGLVAVDGDKSHTHGPGLSLIEWDWLVGGDVVATGESAILNLTVGEHIVNLNVLDSGGNTGSDFAEVVVLPGGFPVIDSLSPTSGSAQGGEPLVINGDGFNFSASEIVVSIGTINLTGSRIQVVNDTSILVLSTPSVVLAAPREVLVTTPIGVSNERLYSYEAAIPIEFTEYDLTSIPSPTVLTFGPDGKLYVGTANGVVHKLTLSDDYTITASVASAVIGGRVILGIAFDPTSTVSPPEVYVSHSAVFHGSNSSFLGVAVNGKVSKLSDVNLMTVEDIVTGLPVSDHDHGVNGLMFDDGGDLYIQVGGNTNAGVPGALSGSGVQEENVLSAATLIARVSQPGFTGNIQYDSAGQLVSGSDIEVFASGERNSYDLVLHSNGNIYATDNGPNTAFGQQSTSCTMSDSDPDFMDKLNLLVQDGFYGHANRARGECVWRGGTEPGDSTYTAPIALLPSSTNGIIEFQTDHFNGQLRGDLLMSQLVGNLLRVVLSDDGHSVKFGPSVLENNGGGLDLTQGPDGSVFVVHYYAGKVIYHKPTQVLSGTLSLYSTFPRSGPFIGGHTLSLFGESFTDNGFPTVSVGGRDCPVQSATDTKIICILSGGSRGYADVEVSVGDASAEMSKGYKYVATNIPGGAATDFPTTAPSDVPTIAPSSTPSILPSDTPSTRPSVVPSTVPTDVPTIFASLVPTALPSKTPSFVPSSEPSASQRPSQAPSNVLSSAPSEAPSSSVLPSAIPSTLPFDFPSSLSSNEPSWHWSDYPFSAPFQGPSLTPSSSSLQSAAPSTQLSDFPSNLPSSKPSAHSSPSSVPFQESSWLPSSSPLQSAAPSPQLSDFPSYMPSSEPSSAEPSPIPSTSRLPSDYPSMVPSNGPTESQIPSFAPSLPPTDAPSVSSFPSGAPSEVPQWEVISYTGDLFRRHENCFVWVNGKGFLIGGRQNEPVAEYDPTYVSWTRKSDTPIPMSHLQCVVVDDAVYIVNAWTGSFPFEDTVPHIHIYNVTSDSWSTKSGLPESRRRGAVANVYVEHGGKRYIYTSHGNRGGHGDHAEALGWLDRYNIDDDEWTTNLTVAPNPRDHAGGAYVNGKICVAGGRDTGKADLFNLVVLPTDCYDIDSDSWEVKSDIPYGRAGSAYGTTCEGLLMVAGGEGLGDATRNVDVFDGETWTSLPGLSRKRHGTGLAFNCVCNEVYIASGSGQQGGTPELTKMERYRPVGSTCT